MRNRLAPRHLRLVPFLAVTAVILYAGLRPEPVPQAFDQQDKLHHMLGFAAYAFALNLAFPRWRAVYGLLMGLALALSIELAQGLQPHRDASLADMAANTVGVLLGWVCWLWVRGGLQRLYPALLSHDRQDPA